MKIDFVLRLATLLGLTGVAARAAVVVTSGAINTAIPDDSGTGLASTLTVSDSVHPSSVSVSLNLSVPAGETGWFGDLYAYVQHDSGIAVLLNRPGRTDASPAGYDDGRSVAITFSTAAANGDIHDYRTVVTGGENSPLTGPLTGTWQPSGRTTDPSSVLGTDPRTALLDSFDGMNAAGTWTLFLADISGGGQFQLDSWSLTFAPVPEPGPTALAASLGLGGWLVLNRLRRQCVR